MSWLVAFPIPLRTGDGGFDQPPTRRLVQVTQFSEKRAFPNLRVRLLLSRRLPRHRTSVERYSPEPALINKYPGQNSRSDNPISRAESALLGFGFCQLFGTEAVDPSSSLSVMMWMSYHSSLSSGKG